jgi:hypothetical protein
VQSAGITVRSPLGAFSLCERGPQWNFDRSEFDHALLPKCWEVGIGVREETVIDAIEPPRADRASSAGARRRSSTGSSAPMARTAWCVGRAVFGAAARGV